MAYAQKQPYQQYKGKSPYLAKVGAYTPEGIQLAKSSAEYEKLTQAEKLRVDTINKEIKDTEAKLNAGQITSIEQIKPELRQYFDIPKDYFKEVQTYQSQKAQYEKDIQRQAEIKQAINIIQNKPHKIWILRYGTPIQQQIVKDYYKRQNIVEKYASSFVISDQAIQMAEVSRQLGGYITPKQVQENINKLNKQIQSGEYTQYIPKQQQQFLQQIKGLKPVYSEGKLVGYDDPVRKMTILPPKTQPKKTESLYSTLPYTDYEKVGYTSDNNIRDPYSGAYTQYPQQSSGGTSDSRISNYVNKFMGERGDKEGKTLVYDKEGNVLVEKEYGWTPNPTNKGDFYGQEEIQLQNIEPDTGFDYYSKEFLPYGVEHIPILLKDLSLSVQRGWRKESERKLKGGNPLIYTDPDVQTAMITGATTPLMMQGGLIGAGLLRGYQAYSGYKFLKDPSSETAGHLLTMTLLPTIIDKGMKAPRVKAGYNTALKNVESSFGKNSKQVIEFKAMWNRAFKELPRDTPIKGEWTSAQVKGSWGDAKAQQIVTSIMRKYKPKVIGSTTIKPQTTLKELPRIKARDVDVQSVGFLSKNSKVMAQELVTALNKAGYKADMRARTFVDGTIKYHVRLNGKELVNIGTSSKYFTKTQAGPILNWYEFERIGAFKSDPYGIKMGNIRDQMRVKLWKGFVERTRPKDIIDAKGIKRGTDVLVEGKKIPKPKQEAFTEKTIEKFYKDAKTVQEKYTLEYMKYKKPVYTKPIQPYEQYAEQTYKNLAEYYNPAYPQSPYPIPYQPYTQYVPKEPADYVPKEYKKPYPYEAYTPYTPIGTTHPIYTVYPTKPRPYKQRPMPYPRDSDRTTLAFRPIMTDSKRGITVYGDSFASLNEAIAEGMIATSESPATEFTIQKVRVPLNQIKKGREALGISSRFMKRKDTFIERQLSQTGKQVRPMSGSWGSFDIRPYVYGGN